MKMWRFIAGLMLPALLLGLVVLFEPAEAQAKRYTLQNATGYPLKVALLVPSPMGWYVHGWYNVQPYSYRRISHQGGGSTFGIYGIVAGRQNLAWQGTSANSPQIAIVDNRMEHSFRDKRPSGSNRRLVKALMVRGDSYVFRFHGK